MLPAMDGLTTSTWSVSAYPDDSIDALVVMVLVVSAGLPAGLPSSAKTVPLTARSISGRTDAIDRRTNVPALECPLGKWRSGDGGVERAPSRGSIDASYSRNRLERRFPLRRHLREWSRRAPRPRAPYRREAWLDGPDAHVHRVSPRRNRCRRSSRRLPEHFSVSWREHQVDALEVGRVGGRESLRRRALREVHEAVRPARVAVGRLEVHAVG